MKKTIKCAAVLGSGVMGSSIAAHLANAGIDTLMLDIVPKGAHENDRSTIARRNKQQLLKQQPPPLTSKANLDLITPGNFEDDIEKIKEADWIIEAVVENFNVKQQIISLIDQHRKKGSIVSSNTSGISIEAIIENGSDDLKRHFLGTHFFNPPRYLKLLEIIPTHFTKQSVINDMKFIGEYQLGKGVVIAKDTPNFIANRIGTYGLLVTIKEMMNHSLSIGEVDSITGTLIGRPKSATFRTLDVVGLDTFIYVANNMDGHVNGHEKEIFTVPIVMQKMVEHHMLGQKSGQGFYVRKKEQGKSVIYELNLHSFKYEQRKKLNTKAVQMAKQAKTVQQKLQILLSHKGDQAADFLWNMMKRVLLYAAHCVGEIADRIVSIDRAMKWGFGWELGPFEMWDAIGVKQSIDRLKQEGEEIPSFITEMLDGGMESFYKLIDGEKYYYHKGQYEPVERSERHIDIEKLKTVHGVSKKNSGASLIDMGDGVKLLAFHSPNNAIGLDIIQMIDQAINIVEENYYGLVIGNEGKNFCVGANLAMMLFEAQDQNFFELELIVRQFQALCMKIKYAQKPIVVAPFNMTLGGGTEITLPAASIQAHQETYMGLVEVGVGLIPGGGGTKELFLKSLRHLPQKNNKNILDTAVNVFEKVAMAKTSSSAEEARELGYLDQLDSISINKDHLLYDAKQKVLTLTDIGFKARKREKVPVVGESGYALMMLGAQSLHRSGYASEYDVKIAEKLAYVLSGGGLREGTMIDEQIMLDLEREAFLSLIGEPKTQARMQHMLQKGKPLRN